LVVTEDSSRHLTEAEIVRGLRNGDAVAWDALCDQFGNRIWAFLVRLVGGEESVVCDLFQDTFLAASKSGLNLDAEGTRLWNWLARIAHNLAAEHWRRVYRDRRFSGATASAESTAESTGFGDPVELMFRAETIEAVRNVLAEMSADHVTVLLAKYVDGQSVATIVDESGGTTEAVRSRLARARRDFKSRFELLNSKDEVV
jgi:RNA polymerase sigma factor (sigma-70 family)